MPFRKHSVLLSFGLSLSVTSALALPIGQRVTIELYDGAHPGTVIGYHPTTGESCVQVDGEESYVNHWLYDKAITAIGGTAAVAPAVTPAPQNAIPQVQPKSPLQAWPKPHQPPSTSQPAAANKQEKYKVGQRIEFIEYGKWFKGIITGLRDDAYAPFHVHALGYEEQEHWAPESFIRPANSGPTEPVPGGEENDDLLRKMQGKPNAGPNAAAGGVPAKHYKAILKVGDQQIDAAPFTITGSSTYTDSVGTLGTYSFDKASSTLTFHGGNYNGARAQYESNFGVPRLFILGKDGNRIIDCD